MNMKEEESGQGDVYLKRYSTPIDYFPVPPEKSVLQIGSDDHVRIILLAADLWVEYRETTQKAIPPDRLKAQIKIGAGRLPLSPSCNAMLMDDHQLSEFTTALINYFEVNLDFPLYLVWLLEDKFITSLGKVMSNKILRHEFWVDSERYSDYVEVRERRRRSGMTVFSS